MSKCHKMPTVLPSVGVFLRDWSCWRRLFLFHIFGFYFQIWMMSTQRQESERRDNPAHHLVSYNIFQSLTTDGFFCFVYFTVFLFLWTIKFEGLYTSADKGNDRTYTCWRRHKASLDSPTDILKHVQERPWSTFISSVGRWKGLERCSGCLEWRVSSQ